MMQPISNIKSNFAEHKIFSISVAVITIALIILSTQNLHIQYFRQFGNMGSSIILGMGSGALILFMIILACKKGSPNAQVITPQPRQIEGTTKIIYNKFTSHEEAMKNANDSGLQQDQVLFFECPHYNKKNETMRGAIYRDNKGEILFSEDSSVYFTQQINFVNRGSKKIFKY